MPTQNELFRELINVTFEYISELKAENARLAASDKSKDEVISQKENEALEAKQLYEGYVSNDSFEDSELIAMMEKFRTDMEATKAQA